MSTIVWTPKNPAASQMWHFMRFVEKKRAISLSNYQALHGWSIQKPAEFWQDLCDFFKIEWESPPTSILNDYPHMLAAKWFTGARFNFAEKLLSRQDNHPALVAINEQGERNVLSYRMLRRQVEQCAAGLKALGVKKNDRVAGVLPNTTYPIIAMLATTALGAIWSSCSPDFGTQALIDRFSQIEPKVLFITDGHQYQGKWFSALEKLDQVMTAVPSIQQTIICCYSEQDQTASARQGIPPRARENEPPHKTLLWENFLKPTEPLKFVSLPFDHPVYILFSSGTTGKPKCIVHGAGGTLLQHLKELALHTDLKDSDNLCFYTTCGWMMWNWMVSALALGTTLTLYEGSPMYPHPGHLFEIVAQEKVSVFGTSAKFISAIEKEGVIPNNQVDLTHLRTILSTGSPLMAKNYDFVYQAIKTDVQLCSISGGTDIVSCFALGNPLLPIYRGELQCLGLGMNVQVFNDEGQAIQQARGELVCTQAFPSMPVGFWNDPTQAKYQHAYFERFPGVWAHGDFAEITAHGGLIIYGRSDAVLNPGGVRIGTAEIYRQIETIPEIVDSVVVGQDWEDDVRIVLFVKLKPTHQLDEHLQQKIKQIIRQNASPRHVPAKILQVRDIPRTISGKIVELAVREIIHDRQVNNLDAIANPEALADFSHREELKV